MVDSSGDSPLWRAAQHELLSHPLRLAIVDALLDAPCGVAELAEAAKAHPNTVRFHLNRLERAGLIESESLRHGSRGRPTKQYRVVEPLESRDAELQLLMKAIVSLARGGQRATASAVATEEGFRLGQELGQRLVDSGDSRDGQWIIRLLRHLSFAPHPTQRRDKLQVDLLHCPFWGGPAEEDGDVVCSFHLGLLQGGAAAAGHDPDTVELEPFVQPRRCRVTVAAQ